VDQECQQANDGDDQNCEPSLADACFDAVTENLQCLALQGKTRSCASAGDDLCRLAGNENLQVSLNHYSLSLSFPHICVCFYQSLFVSLPVSLSIYLSFYPPSLPASKQQHQQQQLQQIS